MKKEIKMCKDCKNYLEFVEGEVECDYGFFEKIKKDDSLIYTPDQFECPFWEKHL